MAGIKKSRSRRGVVLVETALVLLILIVLTMGLIEYGYLFLKSEQLQDAARQGARTAVLPDATTAKVQTAVSEVMTRFGFTSYNAPVCSPTAEAATKGQTITCTMTAPYSPLIGIIPTPSQLTAKVSMAKEGP